MKLKFHRFIILGVLFAAVCVIYVSLLVSAERLYGGGPAVPNDENTVSYETVYAVRGEIFDRNGVPLSKNAYRYSLVLEYDAAPENKRAMNDLFLYAEYVIALYNQEDNVPLSQSPFVGMYPDISYDEEKLKDTTVSANLSYVRKIYGITEDDCETVVNRLVRYFGLLAEDENGERLYTDEMVTRLLSKRYDCVAKKFGPEEPYVFCDNVSEDVVLDVQTQNLQGLSVSVDCRRYYPNDGVATHIIGRLGKISPQTWPYYKELGYSIDDTVGVSGAEQAFESYLRGVNGKKKVVRNPDGVVISEEMIQEPKKGNDVYLTIDIELQKVTQQALEDTIKYIVENAKPTANDPAGSDASVGSAVVMDPDTFEILAMASYPSYTMEEYEKEYDKLLADKNAPLYFRALNGLYAPGSTFKVGMAVASLEEGIITPSTTIDTTNGAYIKKGQYKYYADYQPTCWIKNMYGLSHGIENVQAAIKNSCNCFFFEVGRLLGIEKMNSYCKLYGLGEETGIELPESLGILAGPRYREEHALSAWTGGDTIQAAIGQSENLFSPVQLCSYISMIMNGGNRYNAHLLSAAKEFGTDVTIATADKELYSSIEISDETLSVIKAGMNEVRTSQGNTSKHFKNCPVDVMIKTGTAEVGGNRSFNATMIGFAENEEKGKLTAAIVIEQGNSGSNCGVAMNAIMTEYFSK